MALAFDVGVHRYHSGGEFDLGPKLEFVAVFVEILDVALGRDEVGVVVTEMEV